MRDHARCLDTEVLAPYSDLRAAHREAQPNVAYAMLHRGSQS